MNQLPLNGLIVLEFSQYLSGPSAGLRLADLGARVIKIERPQGGDPCRKLAVKNLWIDDDALNFHAINRNKESFTADLKNKEDLALVKKLIRKADIITHNFRPGVMEKIGLTYADAKAVNEKIIYAEITGFGRKGPWAQKPGQDLLVQSLSGLAYTTGSGGGAPVPFGLSAVDTISGIHLVQAVLGALIRRQREGKGAYIELSLIESAIGMQFELFTTFFHSKNGIHRSKVNNGNPLLGAPYGIYKTADHFISLAMMELRDLAAALGWSELNTYRQEDVFQKRDEIKTLIAKKLKTNTTRYWLERLHRNGLWAAAVYSWKELDQTEGYKVLKMEQELQAGGKTIRTTRCPIILNGKRLVSAKTAPALGADRAAIINHLMEG
ncbi:CaiB/BaiF CoA transferase family protein [Niabella beijingensis]|uniref:CaiB/BaiF CoA transferase family protein n=1 Tax=Niabella beijingensis TaxID=2872700 RepID=UPI001CBD0513|nr:CaiB/BaiF CoA-transferase family protein [Niabella beijingensis]MBZ4188088.1 CoA transferase [Niabella beijingensis]